MKKLVIDPPQIRRQVPSHLDIKARSYAWSRWAKFASEAEWFSVYWGYVAGYRAAQRDASRKKK